MLVKVEGVMNSTSVLRDLGSMPVNISVSASADFPPGAVSLKNNGIHLKSKWPASIGEEYELKLEVPGRRLELNGVVVGCEEDEWRPGVYDLSVYFIGLNATQQKQVHTLARLLD